LKYVGILAIAALAFTLTISAEAAGEYYVD